MNDDVCPSYHGTGKRYVSVRSILRYCVCGTCKAGLIFPVNGGIWSHLNAAVNEEHVPLPTSPHFTTQKMLEEACRAARSG